MAGEHAGNGGIEARHAGAGADVLEGLVRHVPDALWTSGPDGVRVFHNARWRELAGAQPRSWEDALHPGDSARVRSEFDAARRAGASFSSEYRLVRPDATEIPVRDRAAPIRNASGRIDGWAGSISAVPAPIAAAPAMTESDRSLSHRLAELGMLYESVPLGIGLVDLQGRFLRANARLAALDAEPAEHHHGRSVRDVCPALADAVEPLLQAATRTLLPAHAPDVSLPDSPSPGLESICAVSVYPVRDLDGTIREFGLLVRDLTEQRRLEAQADRALRLESLEHLALSAANDLNNLFTVIMGRCDAATPDPLARTAFREIEESIRRAAVLTRHLFAVAHSRVQGRRECDLADLVRENAPVLAGILKPSAKIELVLRDASVRADVDPGVFAEILTHLASGARERLRGGGVMQVRVGLVDWGSEFVNRIPEAVPGTYAQVIVEEIAALSPDEPEPAALRADPSDEPDLSRSARRMGGHVRVRTREGPNRLTELVFPAACSQVERSLAEMYSVVDAAPAPSC